MRKMPFSNVYFNITQILHSESLDRFYTKNTMYLNSILDKTVIELERFASFYTYYININPLMFAWQILF